MSVLTLTPKTTGPSGPQPVPYLVNLFTQMLAKAQSGELQMAAVAYISDEGVAGTAYVDDGGTTLLGVVTKLQLRIAGDIK